MSRFDLQLKQIPDRVLECGAATDCRKSSFESTIEALLKTLTQTEKSITRALRARSPAGKRTRKRSLIARLQADFEEMRAAAESLPREGYQC